jgi:ketosteroid isomerase-like protein
MASHGLVERLRQAVDDHDLDALAACFAPDFRNETPAHPSRGFSGRDQVRANWARIFGGIPDITAQVVRTAVDRDVVWTEWEMGGTRVDGVAQTLRGVIVFGVSREHLSWCRFYLEPVDGGEEGVEAAIGHIAEPGR